MQKKGTILLINPKPGMDWKYIKDDPLVGPPIGVLCVGSALKRAGFGVRIIDAAVEAGHLGLIEKEARLKPIFIGLSVMTPQLASALEIADLVKGKFPKIPLVWGGIHPSLYPEQTLNDAGADIIVRGIGEETALELSERLHSGNCLNGISGLGIKGDNGVILAPEREFPLSMDKFPELDYGLLDVEKYINRRYPEWKSRRVRTLMVFASIGCPYRCRFCINSVIHNSRYVYKPAGRILDEIEFLIGKYNISHINFRDEDFFASKQRLGDFLDGVKGRQLKFSWEANARASYFNSGYLSQSMLKRLEESGCVRLGIGAESGSDRILRSIRKDITTEQIMESARMSKATSIVMGYSFMMGLPGERNQEMAATSKFIIRLAKENKRNYFIGPQVYRPYPGSELYKECLARGLKEPTGLRDWSGQYQRMDIITGHKQDKLPWIDDISFVKILHFYSRCSVVFTNKDNPFEKIFRKILSAISTFRIKHNLFCFPIEYYFYCLGRKNV